MLRRFVPWAHAGSVYEVDPAFYVRLGVRYLLVDLDNTLDSYRTKIPSERAHALKDRLTAEGLELIIVSNNTGKRVRAYAGALGVSHLFAIGKPFARRLGKYLESRGIRKDEAMIVGDQLLTDVACANRAGIRSLLTDRIVREDQPVTWLNRLIERPIMRKLKKGNMLRDWREI